MVNRKQFTITWHVDDLKLSHINEEEVEKILEGKMKNFCQIDSNGKKIMLKYEPIFVFRKVK